MCAQQATTGHRCQCPHTYLLRRTIAAWRRPISPPTPPACSPIGSREARGAARSNEPRPFGPCASAGRLQGLWASRHARERRLGGPATASALELVASIEPLLAIHHPDGRTLLGVHPVAHPGGAPPACSRSTSSRSPTPCGTRTTAGSTTASTTAAWRRPMASAPAPPPVAPPCSPRRSSGAGATARCNLPPCRACRARRHLRRCRRPDLPGGPWPQARPGMWSRPRRGAVRLRGAPVVPCRRRMMAGGYYLTEQSSAGVTTQVLAWRRLRAAQRDVCAAARWPLAGRRIAQLARVEIPLNCTCAGIHITYAYMMLVWPILPRTYVLLPYPSHACTPTVICINYDLVSPFSHGACSPFLCFVHLFQLIQAICILPFFCN